MSLVSNTWLEASQRVRACKTLQVGGRISVARSFSAETFESLSYGPNTGLIRFSAGVEGAIIQANAFHGNPSPYRA
jgi:hypothetical protein